MDMHMHARINLAQHGRHEGGAVLLVEVDDVHDVVDVDPHEEGQLDLDRLPVLAPRGQRAALPLGSVATVLGKLDGE